MQFLWCALLLASRAQTPFDFTAPGASVRHVLQAIHVKTGADLRCDAAIADEVLIVDAHQVTERDLLGRIAQILGATWQDNLLSRKGRTWQDWQDREFRNKRAFADKFLASKRKEAADFKVLSESEADSGVNGLAQADKLFRTNPGGADAVQVAAIAKSPTGRLLTRMLGQTPADEIAKLDLGEAVVYSNHPTKMQRALPLGITPLLEQFKAEQSRWAAAASKVRTADATPGSSPEDPLMTFTESPTLILLRVQSEPDNLSFRLELADERGKRLASAGVSDRTGREEPLPNELLSPDDKLVSYSSITQSFLDMLKVLMMGPRKGQTIGASDPKLIEFLENPADHEPLQLIVGDALVAVARSQGLNLMANPPDDVLFELMQSAMTGHLSVHQVVASAPKLGLELTSADGWLTVTQLTPIANQHYRFDRAALGAVMKAAIEKHHLSLDQVGAYASTLHCKFDDSLSVLFFLTLVPDLASALGGRTSDSDFFKVFGLLTDEQKSELAGGRPVPFRDLAAEEKLELAKIVYWEEGGVQYTSSGPAAIQWDTVITEPTVCAGAGIPDDAPLRANVVQETVVYASSSTPDPDQPWPQPENPEQLAMAMQSKASVTPSGRLKQAFDQFRLGTLRRWHMTFTIAPGISLERDLVDTDFDPKSTPLTYDQLPQDFKAKVQAAIERAKRIPHSRLVSPGDAKLGQLDERDGLSRSELQGGNGIY